MQKLTGKFRVGILLSALFCVFSGSDEAYAPMASGTCKEAPQVSCLSNSV